MIPIQDTLSPIGKFFVARSENIGHNNVRLDLVINSVQEEITALRNSTYTKADIDNEFAEVNSEFIKINSTLTQINVELSKKVDTQSGYGLISDADKSQIQATKTATETLREDLAGKASSESVSNLQTEMAVQTARMDQLVGEVPAGSADEIADARVMTDGKTAANLGDAIRTQSSRLKEQITNTNSRISNIIAQSGTSDTEVVDARFSNVTGIQYDTLSDRLEETDSKIDGKADIKPQNDRMNYLFPIHVSNEATAEDYIQLINTNIGYGFDAVEFCVVAKNVDDEIVFLNESEFPSILSYCSENNIKINCVKVHSLDPKWNNFATLYPNAIRRLCGVFSDYTNLIFVNNESRNLYGNSTYTQNTVNAIAVAHQFGMKAGFTIESLAAQIHITSDVLEVCDIIGLNFYPYMMSTSSPVSAEMIYDGFARHTVALDTLISKKPIMVTECGLLNGWECLSEPGNWKDWGTRNFSPEMSYRWLLAASKFFDGKAKEFCVWFERETFNNERTTAILNVLKGVNTK